jgi:hypothetical protein
MDFIYNQIPIRLLSQWTDEFITFNDINGLTHQAANQPNFGRSFSYTLGSLEGKSTCAEWS